MSASEAEIYRRALHRSIEKLLKLHPVMEHLTFRQLLVLSFLPMQGTVTQAADLGLSTSALHSTLRTLHRKGLALQCSPGVIPGVPGTRRAGEPDRKGPNVWRLTLDGEALFIAPPTKIISHAQGTKPPNANPPLSHASTC